MPRKPDVARLAASAQHLPLAELEYLIERLGEILDNRKRQEQEAQNIPSLENWKAEYRKCGKPGCWCATAQQGHGPYYYRSVRVNGKPRKEYKRVGKR